MKNKLNRENTFDSFFFSNTKNTKLNNNNIFFFQNTKMIFIFSKTIIKNNSQKEEPNVAIIYSTISFFSWG